MAGEPANDFRDQRQTLLQELTHLTGATAREEANGQVTVTIGGLLLVGGARFATLDSSAINAAGLHSVTYRGPDGSSFDASALITSGKIGSVLAARDGQVTGSDRPARSLRANFGDPVQHPTCARFYPDGRGRRQLVQPDRNHGRSLGECRGGCCAGRGPAFGRGGRIGSALPGDNRNALALIGLRSTNVAALGGVTLEDNFLTLVGDIGARAQAAQSRADFQKTLLTNTQARRESTSGVNIDEEMIKLIQFQRAFESSSLVVRTADEMYQTLIDMVR